MESTPELKLCVVALNQVCFPSELSLQRWPALLLLEPGGKLDIVTIITLMRGIICASGVPYTLVLNHAESRKRIRLHGSYRNLLDNKLYYGCIRLSPAGLAMLVRQDPR
jgi:hypothetical protein